MLIRVVYILKIKNYKKLYIMGNVLLDKGELDAAIHNYEKAIDLKADFMEAYYNLGNVFQPQKNLDKAISVTS